MTPILNAYGRPLRSSHRTPKASKDSGSFRGTSFESWNGPQTQTTFQETRERVISQRRAADLYANDWAAHAAVDSISSNAVGIGLRANSNIPEKILGISKEEALAVSEQMEWAFALWIEEADLKGMLDFYDLQLLGLQQILSLGEMVHIPVMLNEKERAEYGFDFSLHLQNISPTRLLSPVDYVQDSNVIDGIRIAQNGRPLTYYILTPKDNTQNILPHTSYFLHDFTEIPANIGHRKGIFHLFKHEVDEQYRGNSIFSKSMGLFRNLDEVISYELIAQVMAACFPVFVSLEDKSPMPHGVQAEWDSSDKKTPSYFQEIREGQIYYGNKNEMPHILESKRPGTNFSPFVDIVLRAISASVGIPFESLTKDFSKTNYSSARAALNEAWKVYNWYRKWFGRRYCQQIWNMVIEEAYLRKMIELPKSAPSFYEARRYWCNAEWIGPARGHIDPVKEVNALIMRLKNHLITYDEAHKELGGDFNDSYGRMMTEAKQIKELEGESNVV